eukprot:TRINITY_DN5481_c0_g1_i1.p1 TRINITY_DN5481_c0_g1~~TRINITY_DN5481_c0_g1_i1.p1  ORF type:complete len:303 (+),score=52.39 TRINITY_DN5481_c0_g1_i1:57-965(+)
MEEHDVLFGDVYGDTGFPGSEMFDSNQAKDQTEGEISYQQVLQFLLDNQLFGTIDKFTEEYEIKVNSKQIIHEDIEMNHAKELNTVISGIHDSNILSVQIDHHVEGISIISTTARGYIYICSENGEQSVQIKSPSSAPVLSLSPHPHLPGLYVLGMMDGAHFLCTIENGDLVINQQFKEHMKFIVKVMWSKDGTFFAVGSRDGYISIYDFTEESVTASLRKKVHIGQSVESIEITHDSKYVIACSQEDNYLHYVSVSDNTENLYNMNLLGDDYVSFVVLDLKLSHNGEYLLAVTGFYWFSLY